ncbi:MAG TPA: TetR/AcrR family transcriptional regulator [Marmoricola sp.]|nr:TetR/AcrR family transcriptional regulator [Marmoricola sp.]
MPKVTPAYRDARRAEILAAARRCFLRQGFHATSMTDLFAETGLSAGAVYGYFSSKDELITAIAEQNIASVVGRFAEVAREQPGSAESVGDLLVAALEVIRIEQEADGLAALAIQVWAEALRNEPLRKTFAGLLDTLHDDLRAVIATRAGTAGQSDQLAALLLTIIPGYIVQLALRGGPAVADVPAAVVALVAVR